MRHTRRSLLRATALAATGSMTAGTAVATTTPPRWKQDTVYDDGDTVSYDGYQWEAHWWTQGEPPADTQAVWNRIGRLPGTDRYPEWTPDGIYREYNRVEYDGAVWEARWWSENETPSAQGFGVWKFITELESADETDSENTQEDDSDDVSQTPVEAHGQLQVIDTNLCDESGSPVQLTGMSTHGIQWYGWGDFLTGDALDALAFDWEADLCRIAMYIQEDGYETDPAGFTAQVHQLIEELTERGLYVIVDFHVHKPGDPLENLENAKTFFDEIAAEHAEKDNIIYEICNEPNNVDWESIKSYAESVIPVIRSHDSASPIVVGTRGWSSLGFADIGPDGPQEIIDNPVEADNILYAYHFYAATHGQWERQSLATAATELPIFVTECGSMEANGDGDSDFESTRAFMDIMADSNISWAFWSYSNDWRTSGIWTEDVEDGSWTVENLTPTGEWVRSEILE